MHAIGMKLKPHLRIGVCEPFSVISARSIIIGCLLLSAKTLSRKRFSTYRNSPGMIN